MRSPARTGARKQDHLEICLDGQVGFRRRGHGFDRYELIHDALPELALDEIDVGTSFLGHELRLPLMVSSMTGGTEEAAKLNRVLARGAQEAGCAISVGSQRAMLEDPSLAAGFRVREFAPDVPLFGNLGAAQLNLGYGVEECTRAVREIEADGLFLHLNSLQEALQPEGDTNFSGLVEKIGQLADELSCPLLLKTTGNGLSATTARKLARLPLAGIEASGAGGTSWARVESARSGEASDAELFGDWGESTADSVLAAQEFLPLIPLVASGGIRNGVDVALSLALGADLAGMALPLLEAASRGEKALAERIRGVARELRISCFYVGAGRVAELDRGVLRERRDGGNCGPVEA